MPPSFPSWGGCVCVGLGSRGCPQAFPAMVNDTWHSFSQHISFIYAHLIPTECLLCTGLPRWLTVKEPANNAGDADFGPWVGKIPWRRAWQLAPVFLPGESPWTEEPGSCKESAHGVAKSRTQLKQLSMHVLCTKPTRGWLFWREDAEVESV